MIRSKLLVTGFGAFGSVETNPSSILAEHLGEPCQILEVSYSAVDDFISQLNPSSFDAWLMLGVAAGAPSMRLEQVARNEIGEHADVRGVAAKGIIDPAGPPNIASTLWSQSQIDPERGFRDSQSAGDYLCNYLLYQGLRRFPDKRIGFLHVPTFETISQTEQIIMVHEVVDFILANL